MRSGTTLVTAFTQGRRRFTQPREMGTYRPCQPTLRHPRAEHRKLRATTPKGSRAQGVVLGFWPVQKVPLLMADTLFLRQRRGVPPAPTRSMVSRWLLPKLLAPPTRRINK
ncbi:Uncharacterized protein DAT39_004982 [Clarias magur]|uniref:Uncharacterized protein n=1 Tax=Clarias magur TaxID=1594786 RepID=A0A8J4UMB8_CLAMG|nr:Uncharacterized protein DAT39_004982 [Clarias magur]